MRKICFAGILALLTGGALFGVGELLVRWLKPRQVLYPRYQFSPEYGLIPFANVIMTHTQPGRFRFTYHINDQHHRGQMIPVSNTYSNKTVVVLGDSYSFGMGVNDGEEYPAVLQSLLQGRFDVINLAAPGWGLTQQIRRFYDMGQQYRPALVILQFCRNDVSDNLVNRVTVIEDGKFQFRNSDRSANRLKKYLSRSILQRSQLYNFFRQDLAARLERNSAIREQTELDSKNEAGGVPADQQIYMDLLDLFAAELKARNTRLFFLAPEGQLEEFPDLKAHVLDLYHRGLLQYLEVAPWLAGVPNTQSPEGHVWGAKAHALIAQHLDETIQAAFPKK